MIKHRYEYMNDANKFGYFYGFVAGTNIVQEYVVQGGIFPTSDLVSNPNYQEQCNNGSNSGTGCSVVLDKQQPDGTYSTNGTGVFGFRADGSYFEWDNGTYEFSETPIIMPASREVIVVGCKAGIQGC